MTSYLMFEGGGLVCVEGGYRIGWETGFTGRALFTGAAMTSVSCCKIVLGKAIMPHLASLAAMASRFAAGTITAFGAGAVVACAARMLLISIFIPEISVVASIARLRWLSRDSAAAAWAEQVADVYTWNEKTPEASPWVDV